MKFSKFTSCWKEFLKSKSSFKSSHFLLALRNSHTSPLTPHLISSLKLLELWNLFVLRASLNAPCMCREFYFSPSWRRASYEPSSELCKHNSIKYEQSRQRKSLRRTRQLSFRVFPNSPMDKCCSAIFYQCLRPSSTLAKISNKLIPSQL